MRVARSIFSLAFVLAPAVVQAQANPAQTHVQHVATAFTDTPDNQGLLAVALADARVAAQHATLAGRTPTNLDALKLHAGHIIHALEPAEGASGPGSGYGVKKAALAVATHIEMAARSQGASAHLTQHAPHIATSARNTVARVDNILSLAKRMQAATSAAEAAAILAELTPVAQALVAGVDANGNGQVEWRQGEGGLQQAEEHLKLMMAAEGG